MGKQKVAGEGNTDLVEGGSYYGRFFFAAPESLENQRHDK